MRVGGLGGVTRCGRGKLRASGSALLIVCGLPVYDLAAQWLGLLLVSVQSAAQRLLVLYVFVSPHALQLTWIVAVVDVGRSQECEQNKLCHGPIFVYAICV